MYPKDFKEDPDKVSKIIMNLSFLGIFILDIIIVVILIINVLFFSVWVV